MSNRRRARPKPAVADQEIARRYRCPDCNRGAELARSAGGFALTLRHRQGCPVALKVTSMHPAARRVAAEVSAELGVPVTYRHQPDAPVWVVG